MSNVKKYVLTAVTLGLIAMASGLLIGATNMILLIELRKTKLKRSMQALLKYMVKELLALKMSHSTSITTHI